VEEDEEPSQAPLRETLPETAQGPIEVRVEGESSTAPRPARGRARVEAAPPALDNTTTVAAF
jgi:hypothetical protein